MEAVKLQEELHVILELIFLMGAATGLLIVTDSLAIYQTLMEIFENGFSFFDETPNDCEDIDKIKKEMEAIVQYS